MPIEHVRSRARGGDTKSAQFTGTSALTFMSPIPPRNREAYLIAQREVGCLVNISAPNFPNCLHVGSRHWRRVGADIGGSLICNH